MRDLVYQLLSVVSLVVGVNLLVEENQILSSIGAALLGGFVFLVRSGIPQRN